MMQRQWACDGRVSVWIGLLGIGLLGSGLLACSDQTAEQRARPRESELRELATRPAASGAAADTAPALTLDGHDSPVALGLWRAWLRAGVLRDVAPSGAAPRAALETELAGADAGVRDAGARGARVADAGDAGISDAGARVADAGAGGGQGRDSDAGAAGVVHPGVGEAAEPAPPLPRDIVERSLLPFEGVAAGARLSARGVWRMLKQRRAICLGELHDNPYHHNLQRRVLERLAALQRARPERRGELAVGYEMFQRQFQQPLSAYVRGELSEPELLEQTEYAARWGADLALYRPLFEANREQGLAALALNAPTELTRAIGRQGLESLSPELAALLPELELEDAEHRAHIFGLFGLTPDDPAAASLENVYRAQVTWDETMAETASEWLLGDGGRRVLAFAGTAHCHESAIPRRVTRRTGLDMLSVAAVLASELEAFPDAYAGYELLIVLADR